MMFVIDKTKQPPYLVGPQALAMTCKKLFTKNSSPNQPMPAGEKEKKKKCCKKFKESRRCKKCPLGK
jgi:hypothetical protein